MMIDRKEEIEDKRERERVREEIGGREWDEEGGRVMRYEEGGREGGREGGKEGRRGGGREGGREGHRQIHQVMLKGKWVWQWVWPGTYLANRDQCMADQQTSHG